MITKTSGLDYRPLGEGDILAQDVLLLFEGRGRTSGHPGRYLEHFLDQSIMLVFAGRSENLVREGGIWSKTFVCSECGLPTPKGIRTSPVCNALYPYLSESVSAQVYTIE